ncbi:MAG: Vitamin B12 dependent methionine synthase activation subunit [Agathobaculum sp.]|jgi:hypothetical protein|uniref:Vitamin B12 dependent methionine synthase activation subunit n=1 Tax=Agathobaculum sp. TaxID=2048138 RepID=UPI003D8C73F6
MIPVKYSEVVRYLGYGGMQPDAAVDRAIIRCIEELQQEAQPKSIYKMFSLVLPAPGLLDIAGVTIHSSNLSRNLTGCRGAYLMAATLGVAVDRRITRAAVACMSDAVIYQAVAAAMIEAYCDTVNDEIRMEAQKSGLYCRPRFSPGYGDFSVAHQQDFARLLDTPRRIGLTVTESSLLAPMKSVTAVIGLSDTPQPCHRAGCEACEKTDCAFRR